MEYRRLGSSELRVSVIALGGWAFGNDPTAWGQVDDNESIATIHCAMDLGVNLIETDPTYGGGHSEQVIGKAIQNRRDRVLITSHCGLIRKNSGPNPVRCLLPDSIRAECEESLRRLRIETIDLYQLHRPEHTTPIGDAIGELLRLREEGKINVIGLHDCDCETISRARKAGPIAALQTSCSLLAREAREEQIPYCHEYNISVLACSPLARGLLSGRLTPACRFSDLRSRDPRFIGERFDRNLNLVQCLATISRRANCTSAQLALRWVLQQTGVTTAVVGVKRISQIEDNAEAGNLKIAPEIIEEVDRLIAEQT